MYAGHFGIEGVLKEELIDLSASSDEEIALLRTSPAAGGIGTCRYKLKAGQDEALMKGELHRVALWLVGALAVLGVIYWAFVHRHMRAAKK